jgi:DNA repair protein RadC
MLIGTARIAADLLAPLFASAQAETVAVIHLDLERRLLALTIEEAGSEAEVELPIRSILAKALRIGSDAIVVAHNHPSGDPTPSAADESATRALAEAAAGVDIRLHDHLIFGGGECRSFRSLGLI